MTTATTKALLEAAMADHFAVPAFNVITLEHAEGIVTGLERAGSSGILQLSERAIAYHGGNAEPILAACASLAASAAVDVALHLDHIQNLELASRLIGRAALFDVSSIMVDFAALDRPENVARTHSVTQAAHGSGLFVEAELGQVGGKDGAHAIGARTEPGDAASFVAETGVDALAIAIGSSHAMTDRTASLDLQLLERLAAAVSVPLVLHGSSGVTETDLGAAITRGIRKINVGTALNVGYTSEVRAVLAAQPQLADPREYLRAGRGAVSQTVVDFCATIANSSGGR